MKKIFKSIVFCYLCAFAIIGKSQNLNTKVLSEYPISVKSKVYKVSSIIQISDKKQLILAELFFSEDTAMNLAIEKGNSTDVIESIKQYYNKRFQNILSSNELEIYYLVLSRTDAQNRANKVIRGLHSSLNSDTLAEKRVWNCYYDKFIEIARFKFQNTLDSANKVRLSKIEARHDSIIPRVLAAEGIYYRKSPFFKVLQNKKELKISSIQNDSLVKYGF